MTDTPPTDDVYAVTQADRESAILLYQLWGYHETVAALRSGTTHDLDDVVQAFARHRLFDYSEQERAIALLREPIDMLLWCPKCHTQHVDDGDERTPGWTNPPHRSHLCHDCGCIWRPADVPTNGVRSIATVGKADNYSPRILSDHSEQERTIARLREVVEGQRVWHESEAKALSKQPPTDDNRWRRMQHQEQIDALDATLNGEDGK